LENRIANFTSRGLEAVKGLFDYRKSFEFRRQILLKQFSFNLSTTPAANLHLIPQFVN
jgi:hypothetical protein